MRILMEKYQYQYGQINAWGVSLKLRPHTPVHVYHVSNALDAIYQEVSRFYDTHRGVPVACTMDHESLIVQPAALAPEPVLFTAHNAVELHNSLRPYLMLLVKG